jgi:hypothetical protein
LKGDPAGGHRAPKARGRAGRFIRKVNENRRKSLGKSRDTIRIFEGEIGNRGTHYEISGRFEKYRKYRDTILIFGPFRALADRVYDGFFPGGV